MYYADKFEGQYKSLNNFEWNQIPKFAVIVGPNGSGKTPLPELIYESLTARAPSAWNFVDCAYECPLSGIYTFRQQEGANLIIEISCRLNFLFFKITYILPSVNRITLLSCCGKQRFDKSIP